MIAGVHDQSGLVEVVERADHPWFVGCQFHPEFKSHPVSLTRCFGTLSPHRSTPGAHHERRRSGGLVPCRLRSAASLIAGNCVVESLETALRTAEVVQREATRRTLNPVFKASFDKANRTRRDSHRGPGMDAGLEVLAQVKEQTGLPILTDVHLPSHCEAAAQVADVLQIPAFLCRQTDLLEAAAATGRVVNIKKGQFVGPEAMQHAVAKIHEAGQPHALLTERGSSFGYGDLIVDYRGFSTLR